MKLKVEWLGGESRKNSCIGCDYMMAILAEEDMDECYKRLDEAGKEYPDCSRELYEEGELYAEVDPADYLTGELREKWAERPQEWEDEYDPSEHDWCEGGFNNAVDIEKEYKDLKAAIIEQAKLWMIAEDELEFPAFE